MLKLHKELFTHFLYWIFKAKPSGLIKTIPDIRRFDLGIFGWGETYKAAHQYKLIPTRRVIDQGSYNICQWCATTIIKETEEGVDLSERSIVSKGSAMGLVSGNGFSELDAGNQVLRKWGIVEKNHFDNNYCGGDWDSFVMSGIDKWSNDAAVHKDSSDWEVKKRGDILKQLDLGKVLKTAITWYTGMNRGGGFSAPWIISKYIGYPVGGHCFPQKGYIYGYKGIDAKRKLIMGPGGLDVYVFQNSYSDKWGATIVDDAGVTHSGLFFITMDFFEKINWGIGVAMDTPVDVGAFINDYNGRNVKSDGGISTYLIKGGKKCKYTNPAALAKSGLDPFIVDRVVLDRVPMGLCIN